jgi:hypothetical protein
VISITTAEASRPRVVAPPGWTIGSTEVVSPSGGTTVVITRLPRGPGDSLEARAEREGARLAAELPGYRQESLERRETPAGEVLVRTYSLQRAGEPSRQVQILAASGASATLDAAAADSELDAAVDAVADFAFGAPRGLSGSYSVEELTALAELAGAAVFPGTGEHAFESERERGAALRALLARGTLRPGADGRMALEPLDERTVETALRPKAVVDVERGEDERCLVYVGAELVVAHSAGGQGVHQLEPLPVVLLGTTLRALAGLGGAAEAGSPGRARVVRESRRDGEVSWGAGEPAAEVAARLEALAVAVSAGAA